MEDPNPQVAGQGFRRLHEAGIAVEIASEYAEEAARLNEAFIHSMQTGLPLVTLKAALTLDGKIAAPEDNSGWITSERARAHVQQIRHNADAILTGIGTVLSDDCLLTDRTGLERSRPLLRIVADPRFAFRSIRAWSLALVAMSRSLPLPPHPTNGAARSNTEACACWCSMAQADVPISPNFPLGWRVNNTGL